MLGMCAGVTATSQPRPGAFLERCLKAGRDVDAGLCAGGAAAMPRVGAMAEGTLPRGPCSPAGSIGEYNVAVLVCALQEGNTGVFLPVPHGLPEDGPLAACRTEEARLSYCPGGPASTESSRLLGRGHHDAAGLLTGEVSPNDKGDDPIGPHALRSGGRRTPAPGPASPPPWASPLRLPVSLLAAGGRGVSWR